MPKEVLGYEDQKYQQKNDSISIIRQIYEDIRIEINNRGDWNKPIIDLNGFNMKMSGNLIELVHTRYELTTPEQLAEEKKVGNPFLKEFVNELKKRFKKITKKKLVMKKVADEIENEKVGFGGAETSWSFGAGHKCTVVNTRGNYLVRTKIAYKFKIEE